MAAPPDERVDHGTICGRTCANSGHYKPLCACVDRTFVNPNSSRRRPGPSFRYRRLSRSYFVTFVRRAYSFTFSRYTSICDFTAETPRGRAGGNRCSGAACAGSRASGMDALHNDVFRNAKSLSQSREPETSMFVLIPRRMEPEHPAVRLKGHSA